MPSHAMQNAVEETSRLGQRKEVMWARPEREEGRKKGKERKRETGPIK